jgi:hypothetical protein
MQTQYDAQTFETGRRLQSDSTPDMTEKLYKAGFQVRPKGGADAWARLTKEIKTLKAIINQAGNKKM